MEIHQRVNLEDDGKLIYYNNNDDDMEGFNLERFSQLDPIPSTHLTALLEDYIPQEGFINFHMGLFLTALYWYLSEIGLSFFMETKTKTHTFWKCTAHKICQASVRELPDG